MPASSYSFPGRARASDPFACGGLFRGRFERIRMAVVLAAIDQSAAPANNMDRLDYCKAKAVAAMRIGDAAAILERPALGKAGRLGAA
jgi:hypothetical protein